MRVVVSGYYGFDNLGDEAILKGQIELLRRKLKNSPEEIVVLSNSPEATSKRYHVVSVKRNAPSKVLKGILGCDLFFNGGGGIFQDVTSRLSPLYYLSIWQFASLVGKSTWVWGQGIGPLSSRLYIKWMSFLMKKAAIVGVRDEDSYRLLKRFGVSEEKLYLSEDLAFAMSVKNTRRKINLESPIGVVLRKWNGVEGFGNRLVSILLDEFKRDIVLMGFSKTQDEVLLRHIYANAKDKKRVHLFTPLSVEDALKVLGEVNITIGMRLHSLIFSAMLSIPFVGISYDPKVEVFTGRLGMDSYKISKNIEREIVKSVKKVYNNYELYSGELEENVAKIRRRCFENFDAAWEKWSHGGKTD